MCTREQVDCKECFDTGRRLADREQDPEAWFEFTPYGWEIVLPGEHEDLIRAGGHDHLHPKMEYCECKTGQRRAKAAAERNWDEA